MAVLESLSSNSILCHFWICLNIFFTHYPVDEQLGFHILAAVNTAAMLGVLQGLSILAGGNRCYSYFCVNCRNCLVHYFMVFFSLPWVVSSHTWIYSSYSNPPGDPSADTWCSSSRKLLPPQYFALQILAALTSELQALS